VWYTNADGDDVSNIRDIDGSVVGLDPATCDKTYTIVKAAPLHLTKECQVRDNWQMAWCCHNYGQVCCDEHTLPAPFLVHDLSAGL
jgi:hypothetical protein